jgi:large subunit ribosomal protein L41
MFGVIKSIPRGASRLQLTAKKGHNFYKGKLELLFKFGSIILTCFKGTGSGAMGRHTKNGGYLVDWNKVRTFVVPDLENFAVCPLKNN